MPLSSKHYQLLALDSINKCVIDEVFVTLDELVAKHGKALGITRRRCESIRKASALASKKYRHICIVEIETSKKKLKELERLKELETQSCST